MSIQKASIIVGNQLNKIQNLISTTADKNKAAKYICYIMAHVENDLNEQINFQTLEAEFEYNNGYINYSDCLSKKAISILYDKYYHNIKIGFESPMALAKDIKLIMEELSDDPWQKDTEGVLIEDHRYVINSILDECDIKRNKLDSVWIALGQLLIDIF